MMIRINLLPVRQAKKKELGRQFLVLAAGMLILSGAGNYMWWASRESERANRENQAAETQRRISELQKVIGEVDNINKRKKEVEEKLAVLDKLRKQRSGPVRMLDALATAIPKKVWISDFTEAASAVKIGGNAESHEDVSEFLKSLANVVWTPKGMARIVEKKRDATTARVELLTGENAMEDFPLTDIANFFTNVELKTSESSTAQSKTGGKLVHWEISMSANYAI